MSSPQPTANGRLFSHFVVRVAGLSASSFDKLWARRSLGVHATIRDLEQQFERVRAQLEAALFASIQGLEDRALRHGLLRLKRDVHNRRTLCIRRLTALREILTPDLEDGLSQYRRVLDQRRALAQEWHRVFDREVTEIRRRFQKLVAVEDFRNGLLLSSSTLAKELPRYIQAAAARPGSRTRKVERSLMRYFSRATMKSTPFSTFCALVPGTFIKRQGDYRAGTFRGDPFHKRGLLRINKALYATILGHLLARPAVRTHFHVELNPTLREEPKGRWLFLSAANGRETFQRLLFNPVLDELRRQLLKADVSLAELMDRLLAEPGIEADQEAVAGYLDRLLEIGFLRFRTGIPEQEVDWDQPLAAILEGVDDEHASAIRALLGSLRAGVERYATSSTRRRAEILQTLEAEITAVDGALEIKLLPRGQPVFYEDVSASADLRLDLGDLDAILVDYVGLVSRIAWPRAEQASMRHFFETYYGSEHGPVPLLSFYEDYYREHFKQHLERERSSPAANPAKEEPEASVDGEEKARYNLENPFDLHFVRSIAEVRRSLSEHLRQRWCAAPDAEEIRLEREDLSSILAVVPEEGASHRSASLFVQWVPNFGPAGESALIANNAFNGYGKYFSRFLSVLPDDVRLALIENNRQLTDRELAEICGDGAFNANLHPPILPREISYPTGESGGAEEQISSARIDVARDPLDPHRLRLQETNEGGRIVPVDLGFLNPRMRPPLYQLLSRFTPPANAQVPVPESLHEAPAEGTRGPEAAADLGADEVRHRPRITYQGRLVLARRRWQISHACFPRKRRKESEADYFLRVRDWRSSLGLPNEVFLRVWPLPTPQPPTPDNASGEATDEATDEAMKGTDAEEAAPDQTDEKEASEQPRRFRQHLYKPQYIDFRNPLLVDLFSRATENLEHVTLTFEERLPRDDQLIESEGERCVTELVVQVDFPQAGPDQENEGVIHA